MPARGETAGAVRPLRGVDFRGSELDSGAARASLGMMSHDRFGSRFLTDARPRRAAVPVRAAVLTLARIFALILSLGLASPQATAQDAAADQPAQTEGGQTEGAQAPADASVEALLRILKDDAAREQLIARLSAAAPAAAEAASPPENPGEQLADALEQKAAETAEVPVSLSRRVAEATQRIAENVAHDAMDAWGALTAAPSRLDEVTRAADPELVLDSLKQLGLAILVTYAAFLTLRALAFPLHRALGRSAAQQGVVRSVMTGALSMVIDVVVVLLAWAAGYAIVTFALGETGLIAIRQTLYLNAFVAVQLASVAVRTLLAPRVSALRPVPLPDAAAKYLSRRLVIAAALLGYGQLLAVPIVNVEAGSGAGAALSAVISLVVVLMAIVATLRHRREVADWLTPDDATGRRMFRSLARVWHVPVLIYLLALFVVVMVRPGNVLFPMLEATARIVAAILLGISVNALLGARARRGVRLSDGLRAKLPLLERRLNGFVPKALTALRILVTLAVAAAALSVVGLISLNAWLDSEAGLKVTAAISSSAMILLVSFAIWLAFASWIDWRLNPDAGRAPTAREATLLTLLRNAVAIALLVITIMFTLSEIGIDIAPLLASAGVLGLAIGFGAQKMVQDIITGVFIQIENAMNVGDVVSLNGTSGVVERLTVRSVTLRDVSGSIHLIPFSSVDMVTNFMKDFSYAVVDAGVAYRENVQDCRAALLEAFERLRADDSVKADILGDMEWFGVQAMGDNAVVLRTRVKTRPGKQWGVGRLFNEKIKEVFDEQGIEIPFPQQTIWFGESREGIAPPARIQRVGKGNIPIDQPPELPPARETKGPDLDIPDSDD